MSRCSVKTMQLLLRILRVRDDLPQALELRLHVLVVIDPPGEFAGAVRLGLARPADRRATTAMTPRSSRSSEASFSS